ncbi:hypothetical protein P7C70_g983, partial [Phenoliferia sp. Uapishka_3]
MPASSREPARQQHTSAPRTIQSRILPVLAFSFLIALTILLLVDPPHLTPLPHDELIAIPRVNATRASPAPFHLPEHSANVLYEPITLSHRVDAFMNGVGTRFLALLGIETDAEALDDGGAYGAGGLAGWSESSVFVEVTNSLHPSRPSAFGPHLVAAPLRAPLYPITSLSSSDEYGCPSDTSSNTTLPTAPAVWIALSQRGHCPFSNKVRHAMAHGASGVIFGDDTSDITIPSAFVSRASYLSLLKTWDDLQEGEGDELLGLMVVMSKDELFAWPLLDFLLLLLFLPSLLTLLTVFTHRVRLMRQRKADRAPRDVVAGLPVFVWGEREGEKRTRTSPSPSADMMGGEGNLGEGTSADDEEATVGLPLRQAPTETTSLLRADATAPPRRFSFFSRLFSPAAAPPSLPTPPTLLPKRKKYVSLNTECAICLGDFVDGERVMELPCGHLYHQEEIESWLLGTKRLCPVCRASVTGESSSPSPPPSEYNVSFGTLPIVISAPGDEAATLVRGAGGGESPVASSSSVTLDSTLADHRA